SAHPPRPSLPTRRSSDLSPDEPPVALPRGRRTVTRPRTGCPTHPGTFTRPVRQHRRPATTHPAPAPGPLQKGLCTRRALFIRHRYPQGRTSTCSRGQHRVPGPDRLGKTLPRTLVGTRAGIEHSHTRKLPRTGPAQIDHPQQSGVQPPLEPKTTQLTWIAIGQLRRVNSHLTLPSAPAPPCSRCIPE